MGEQQRKDTDYLDAEGRCVRKFGFCCLRNDWNYCKTTEQENVDEVGKKKYVFLSSAQIGVTRSIRFLFYAYFSILKDNVIYRNINFL